MDRGAWQATLHGVIESDMTEQLTHKIKGGLCPFCSQKCKFLREGK